MVPTIRIDRQIMTEKSFSGAFEAVAGKYLHVDERSWVLVWWYSQSTNLP